MAGLFLEMMNESSENFIYVHVVVLSALFIARLSKQNSSYRLIDD